MKTVFFDVDTQLDFVFPAGALYVLGAEKIVPALARLTNFAASASIPLISTIDAHTENDLEFRSWKPHCVVGTTGQQKCRGTLLSESFILPSKLIDESNLSANAKLSPQILVEKQNIDCFTNANLLPLLTILAADLYIVYGVATEVCVQKAAFGLLNTGARVHVLIDAVASLNRQEADRFFAEVEQRGGQLISTASVTS